MKSITIEEFEKAINKANEDGITFYVTSVDIGNIYLDCSDCILDVDMENGIQGELSIRVKGALVCIAFDFNIVEEIVQHKDSNGKITYALTFNNGVHDLEVV